MSRICKYEPCNENMEGRFATARFCSIKCKNNHGYHNRNNKTTKVVKPVSPEFLTRGKMHYAGLTTKGS